MFFLRQGKKNRGILLLLIIFKGIVLGRDRHNKTNGNTIGHCSRASFHFGYTNISIGTASSVKTASRTVQAGSEIKNKEEFLFTHYNHAFFTYQ